MKSSRHAALDRTRAEQGDVRDHVLRAAGLEPLDQILLAGRLELEHSDRVRVLDERESEPVIERDVVGVVEVDRPAGRAADLLHCVGHGGLHADAEDIEL